MVSLPFCSLCSKISTENSHFPEMNIKLLGKLSQYFVITLAKTDLLMAFGFELLLALDVPVFLVSKHHLSLDIYSNEFQMSETLISFFHPCIFTTLNQCAKTNCPELI